MKNRKKSKSFKFGDEDLFDYLCQFKNPLDKKYRWEVNNAYKAKKITEGQRNNLLTLTPQALYELSVCVRNGVAVDVKQVGNFYWNRAIHYNNHKRKKREEFLFIFSN